MAMASLSNVTRMIEKGGEHENQTEQPDSSFDFEKKSAEEHFETQAPGFI